MTEREMFEGSFQRPCNFFYLSEHRQFQIDKELGILDWLGEGLTKEDIRRYKDHYGKCDASTPRRLKYNWSAIML